MINDKLLLLNKYNTVFQKQITDKIARNSNRESKRFTLSKVSIKKSKFPLDAILIGVWGTCISYKKES